MDTNGQSSNGAPQQDVIGHARGMMDEAQAFGRSLGEAARGASQAIDLQGRVQRNPVGMMLAAAGIGYVLGGGLFTPLTGRLVRMGLRLAILPLVKGQVAAMAQGMGVDQNA